MYYIRINWFNYYGLAIIVIIIIPNIIFAIKCKNGLGKILYIPDYGGNWNEFETCAIVTSVYSSVVSVHVQDLLSRADKGMQITVIQNFGRNVCGADRLAY